MRSSFISLIAVLATFAPAAARATLTSPAAFSESTLLAAGSTPNATSMAWAPDGSQRLFITQKNGTIRIVKQGSLLATPFAVVTPVFTNSECGLLGVAFDPSFTNNGYVYVFVTVSSTEQQIIRYTASGNVGSDETVIVSGLPTRGVNHDGGAIGFGPDGKLYWAIGDNGNGTGVNADLTSMAAKVGRANRDGSLPQGNPFADGAGPQNDYIWARGLRNPFALAFQPGTGALWVDVAGTSYEQIFVLGRGAHAGYNAYESNQPAGFTAPVVSYLTNGSDSRTITTGGAVRSAGVTTITTSTAHRLRPGASVTLAGVSNASFNGTGNVLDVTSDFGFTLLQAGADAVSGSGNVSTLNIGGAVTGGDFWSSSALSAAYRGNYFFGDYVSGRLERVVLRADNTVSAVEHFAFNYSSLVDVSSGPDGALYALEHGGTVRRISVTSAAQALVVAPLHVRLDENGAASVAVRLAQAIGGSVTVSAALSGSADVSLGAGNSLTFTSANWSVPQFVQLLSVQDADANEDVATLSLTSPGLASEAVGVAVTDTVGSNTTPTPAAATKTRHGALLALFGLACAFVAFRRRAASPRET